MDSTQALLELAADQDLTLTDHKVLEVLKAIQDPAGFSHATAQQIADHITAHRPTVSLSLQHLAAKGLITGGRGKYRVAARITEPMDVARERLRIKDRARRSGRAV